MEPTVKVRENKGKGRGKERKQREKEKRSRETAAKEMRRGDVSGRERLLFAAKNIKTGVTGKRMKAAKKISLDQSEGEARMRAEAAVSCQDDFYLLRRKVRLCLRVSGQRVSRSRDKGL